MANLDTTLSQLRRWSETLAYDCQDGAAPLVEGIIDRLHGDAVALGATAEQLAAAETVPAVAA
jgi:hypothetical protein